MAEAHVAFEARADKSLLIVDDDKAVLDAPGARHGRPRLRGARRRERRRRARRGRGSAPAFAVVDMRLATATAST